MPRARRTCPDGLVQHVLNRGNLRADVFSRPADYLGFLAAMADAAERTVVRVAAFILMPNHWHLVLWPHHGREISAYMQILMNSHIRDIQRRHRTIGTGHIYQGRYRNVPITTVQQFYNVCAYVQANARTAGLVRRAEDWPWSSLATSGPAEGINLLSAWPVPRPDNWLEIVNRPRQVGDAYAVAEISVPKVPATPGTALLEDPGRHASIDQDTGMSDASGPLRGPGMRPRVE